VALTVKSARDLWTRDGRQRAEIGKGAELFEWRVRFETKIVGCGVHEARIRPDIRGMVAI
jgi:hypothetical protein